MATEKGSKKEIKSDFLRKLLGKKPEHDHRRVRTGDGPQRINEEPRPGEPSCSPTSHWNECVGLDRAREDYRKVWETIEASNPEFWNEFKTNDINALIDELARFKTAHYPDDRRRILTCGIPDGKVRVEWLPAAAPGVDSRWEMQ